MAQPEGFNSKLVVDLLLKGEDIDAVKNMDVKVQSAAPEGYNFFSKVYRVNLKCQLSSGKEKNVSAVCKDALPVQGSRDFSDVLETEIKAYSIILHLMDNLMEEFSDSREKLWCKFYGQTETNTLVFEDLAELGFYTYDRVDWLLEADATLVMKELGRFHAMSRILIERGSFQKDDFPVNSWQTDSEIWGKMYQGPLILLSEVVESWGPEWQDTALLVKQQIPLACQKITELINGYDKRFEVFNHGDVWTCNVMKRNESSVGGTSIRFIDFQQPGINSFMVDILTFLQSSVNPSIRRNKIDTFLTVYAESLQENLRFFGSKGYLPSTDDVKSEYKRMEYVAFVFSVAYFPVTSTDSNFPLRIDKIFDYPARELLDKNAFTDKRIAHELKIDLKLFEHLLR